jgi:hypothetical protein
VLWFRGPLRGNTVGVPWLRRFGVSGAGSILPVSIFLWFRGPSCQPTWELESSVVVEEDGAIGVSDDGILGEGEGGGVAGDGDGE